MPATLSFLARELLWPASDGMDGLPDPTKALTLPDGLCGIVRRLDPQTLLAAYRRALFPGGHVAPFKWFSPSRRPVLKYADLVVTKEMRRILRKRPYTVSFDKAFDDVVMACAQPRHRKPYLTWLRPRLRSALSELHRQGHAHSFEVWNEAGELVGGGYGLAVGRVFFAESNFSRAIDSSKIGFLVLTWHLNKSGFLFTEGKFPSAWFTAMGATMIERAELMRALEQPGDPASVGAWTVQEQPQQVAEQLKSMASHASVSGSVCASR